MYLRRLISHFPCCRLKQLARTRSSSFRTNWIKIPNKMTIMPRIIKESKHKVWHRKRGLPTTHLSHITAFCRMTPNWFSQIWLWSRASHRNWTWDRGNSYPLSTPSAWQATSNWASWTAKLSFLRDIVSFSAWGFWWLSRTPGPAALAKRARTIRVTWRFTPSPLAR